MKLSIVVPVYKEEGNVPEFISTIRPILEKITSEYEIIFAHDPSSDRTMDIILEAHKKDSRIKLLEFSRRFGQPMATLAGLQYSTGEAVVVMDVDLQDPPSLIAQMVVEWQKGCDVVYAQRRSRKGETIVYRIVTFLGYKLIKRMAEGVNIPENTGDFRLMSRRAVNQVINLKESHGFLRGMVALVGFRQTTLQFDRPRRFSGAGNYNRFFGSLRIGVNGLICFSSFPLTLCTLFGFGIAVFSFCIAFFVAVLKILGFHFPLGIPTVVMLILFMGGIQLISVGILGEYIGRIYDEIKQRPRFIVDRQVGFNVEADRGSLPTRVSLAVKERERTM